MPWNTFTTVENRHEFVRLASAEGANISELCRRFGISRKTGYKFLSRWASGAGDVSSLEDRSRRPLLSPGQTGSEMEELVVAARSEHPVWGGRKLRAYLISLGHEGVPSASTITSVLRRRGLLGSGAGGDSAGVGWRRFERERPNELWQMDFKGDFGLSVGGRCYPLTVTDDHSRFNLVLASCGNQRGRTVEGHLEAAFRRYGLPERILCDNGPPWGDACGMPTTLGVWLLLRGVEVSHGRPYHPQTQGKEERFHRTLKAEVLSRETVWRDRQHCQGAFDAWREVYNHVRPHESLDDAVPSSRYRISGRALPERPPAPSAHYLEGDEIRSVKSKGEITFRNVFYYVGRAYRGHPIALRPAGEDRWDVYFAWKRLGGIDLRVLAGKEKGRYEALQQ